MSFGAAIGMGALLLAGQLGARATLKLFQDADHSFHVPARTGRKDSEIMAEISDVLADWIGKAIARTVRR